MTTIIRLTAGARMKAVNRFRLIQQSLSIMPGRNKYLTYQQALNHLAYLTSHRLRSPISTLQGLVELIRLDLVKKEERVGIMENFRMSLCQLDFISRELASLIHDQQQRIDKRRREGLQKIIFGKRYPMKLNNRTFYLKRSKAKRKTQNVYPSLEMRTVREALKSV